MAGDLTGKSVVFTGTMSLKRAELTDMATAAGARVTAALSGRTDILVVRSPTNPSKKRKKEKKIKNPQSLPRRETQAPPCRRLSLPKPFFLRTDSLGLPL